MGQARTHPDAAADYGCEYTTSVGSRRATGAPRPRSSSIQRWIHGYKEWSPCPDKCNSYAGDIVQP